MPEIIPGKDREKTVAGEKANKVVVFTVGREYFALPLESLAEIYRSVDITPVPLAPRFLKGVVSVHGQLASVMSLGEILEAPALIGNTGLLLILAREFGGIALLVEKTTGFSSYGTLEEVTMEQAPDSGSVHFLEGVFRDKGTLVTLISPEKLRIWIDQEFAKEEE